jgi:acyl carrier protein
MEIHNVNEEAARQWIVAYIAEFLDIPEDRIKADEPLQNYGLDSSDSIIIGGAFEDEFNVEIDATLFLRNDNIDDLIDDLRESGLMA